MVSATGLRGKLGHPMRRCAFLLGVSFAACTFHLPLPVDAIVAAEAGAAGSEGGVAAPDGGLCPSPTLEAPPILLVDFESGVVPSSSTSPIGLTQAGVGTIVRPGANGTATGGQFPFDRPIHVEGQTRARYLATGSGRYDPNAGNAVELYVRIPLGSPLLQSSGASTFSFFHYSMKPGDPWVGPNSGGNLPDSEMHGRAYLRFGPAVADRWIRVVLSPSALGTRSHFDNMYAARSVSEDLSSVGSLRGFFIEPTVAMAATDTIAIDELRLVTIRPTATVCPDFTRMTAPAGGGDVRVPLVLSNPGPSARRYRAFISSVIGIDRQPLEVAVHDADDANAAAKLQSEVGAAGGLGAVELFASDPSGNPTGPSIVPAGGAGVEVAAGGTWRGVLVHHVRAPMLGPPQNVAIGPVTYAVRRDTLTTSVVFWDPNEPRVGDPGVIPANQVPERANTQPPGFPPSNAVAAGWGSTDIPFDQVGAYHVSIIGLQP
jgi:hypothetical protein